MTLQGTALKVEERLSKLEVKMTILIGANTAILIMAVGRYLGL